MDPHGWRLDGQLTLVTGGSAGFGRAIARELLGFGAQVLIVARDAVALDRARDELAEEFPDGQIHALVADVADDEQRREVLDWVEVVARASTSWSTTPAATVARPRSTTPRTIGAGSSRSTCFRHLN